NALGGPLRVEVDREHLYAFGVCCPVTVLTPEPPRGAWRARLPSPEERAAELERDERLVRRDIRAAGLRTLGVVGLSLGLGLALMGIGLHTTDPGFGQIAFLGGLIVGYAGILVSCAQYYRRGQAQGWWR